MTTTLAERPGTAAPIPQIVADLASYPGVVLAVVVGRDGLLLGSAGRDDERSEFVGAITASLLALSDRHLLALGAGETEAAQFDFYDGCVLIKACGGGVIAVYHQQRGDLGPIKHALRGHSRQLQSWFAELRA